MRGRLRVTFTTAIVACTLLAATAPTALAIWYIADPVGLDVGYVVKTSAVKFTVKTNSGVKVGTLVKTAPGRWIAMRDGKKIGVVKTSGTKKYPVSLFRKDGTGPRTGCCGLNNDGDARLLYKCCNGTPYVCVGSAEKDCPGRAAMGAARLLLW
jgi:hypothetical protein